MTKDLVENKKILTIAGSDILSGGGMQADLATFAANGLYGFCALTSIVTVNDEKFWVHPVAQDIFQEELNSLADVEFSAIKIGLLPNTKILQQTTKWLTTLSAKSAIPIVLDPVIVFKENADYSVSEMREFFISELFPLASVVTPNLKEAEILTGQPIKTKTEMEAAAKALYDFGAKNVVIKGGNRFDQSQAIDLVYDGKNFFELTNPLLKNNNNGAGCTFAASIASQLAKEKKVEEAVKEAKTFVYQAIQNANEYGVFQNKKINFQK